MKAKKVVLIGPFPPPLHGMASINLAMKEFYDSQNYLTFIFNTSAPFLSRAWYSKSFRGLRILKRLFSLIYFLILNQGSLVYLSVSGGNGQIYEIIFLIVSRLCRCNIILHHHNFSYLSDTPTPLISKVLVFCAGIKAKHIALCRIMALKLMKTFPAANNIIVISNAAFVPHQNIFLRPKKNAHTLGYLGNIEGAKGIYEYLDVLDSLQASGSQFKGLIAGPFFDDEIKNKVITKLSSLKNVVYVGPVYGKNKENFFRNIDVLLYPTKADAEPLTILEALSYGVPVLSCEKGCISEIIDDSVGMVSLSDEDFVTQTLLVLNHWQQYPSEFFEKSVDAQYRFFQMKFDAKAALEQLLYFREH